MLGKNEIKLETTSNYLNKNTNSTDRLKNQTINKIFDASGEEITPEKLKIKMKKFQAMPFLKKDEFITQNEEIKPKKSIVCELNYNTSENTEQVDTIQEFDYIYKPKL